MFAKKVMHFERVAIIMQHTVDFSRRPRNVIFDDITVVSASCSDVV